MEMNVNHVATEPEMCLVGSVALLSRLPMAVIEPEQQL